MSDDITHEPSAAFYEGVGRVAVAAGKLDVILAQLVAQLRSQELPESGGSRDWITILSGKIGTPRKHFTHVASQLAARPSSAALLSLHLDVEEALDERDQLIHSFHMTTVDEAGASTGMLYARSRAEIDLATCEQLRVLDERLEGLMRRALMMLLQYLTPAPTTGSAREDAGLPPAVVGTDPTTVQSLVASLGESLRRHATGVAERPTRRLAK